MRSANNNCVGNTRYFASIGLAAGLAVTCLSFASNGALAEEAKNDRAATKPAPAKSPAAKIDEKAAADLALKKVPGTVTAVDMEKKKGRNVFVVEIIEAVGGKETDVFIDPTTGEVVGTD